MHLQISKSLIQRIQIQSWQLKNCKYRTRQGSYHMLNDSLLITKKMVSCLTKLLRLELKTRKTQEEHSERKDRQRMPLKVSLLVAQPSEDMVHSQVRRHSERNLIKKSMKLF